MPAALWTGREAHPDRVTADLTGVLGRELGLARPPVAVTLPPDSTGVPAGSLLPPRERFSGMPAPTLCYVYVDARAPRPFELRASLMAGRALVRRSLGLGQLFYAVPLTRSVPARTALSAPRRFGPSSFEGDAGVAGRLNADRELVADANALTPLEAGPDASHTWSVERLLAVEPLPGEQGSVLLLRTLHRAAAHGWSLRADAVLNLAARIEAVLG
ncbi:hypothetical protein [Streptomyces sp. CB01881]|uniref:hypothetical protein n=1 Tax=Streptomyces sp. CB01881 TaxID=2078691 RepID=UPI000CDC43B4|nr:hypothetical protein [Streptomyces sp. CB01881]AUY52844.1 hypothetical protein C2142_32470 [Streptomyces sp. CB01881]TYC70562.1 hypothetical protein EH183_32535 [Streptomyces sp. CB01881]